MCVWGVLVVCELGVSRPGLCAAAERGHTGEISGERCTVVGKQTH